MRVEIQISADIKEPYAVIYSDRMTNEIQQIADRLSSSSNIITVMDNEQIMILQPEEIYMLQTETEQLAVYCQHKKYITNKPLYRMQEILGNDFMRISKSTIINLKKVNSVEPSFNGTMLVVLKNGNKDYISRKYLPGFKKYLGM